MKPLLLKFCAFGPYADEQIIDFEALSASGLFLIHGETGSGKTVILDAITYALYGESSGGIRGGLASMRCQFANEDKETYVEFTFESGGRVYTFSHRLKTVHRRTGQIDYNPVRGVLEKKPDGTYEPLFENPKASLVREEAQRIIGLDYDQFRQIIILPQGQFEKLLIADSGAKEQILSTLFSAQKWDRVSEFLTDKVRSAKSDLAELDIQVKHIYEENSCETAEEMDVLFEQRKADTEELLKKKDECEKLLKTADDEYDKTKALFDLYSQHELLTTELAELEGRADEICELELLLRASENAHKVKPSHDVFTVAQKTLTQRRTALDKAEEAFRKAEEELTSAQAAADGFENRSAEMTDLEKQLVRLDDMRSVYENIEAAKSAADEAEKKRSNIRSELEQLEEKYVDARSHRSQLEEEQASLYEQYILLFRSSDVAGRLASELEDGKPCPVCGSLNHPKKAVYDDSSSHESLSEKQNEIDAVSAQLKEVQKNLTGLDDLIAPLRDSANAADAEYTRCIAQYEALSKNASDEFEDAAALSDKICEITDLVEKYKSDRDSAKTALDNARTSLSAARAIVVAAAEETDNAEKDFEAAEKEFTSQLEKYGFEDADELAECMLDDERTAATQSEISQYRESIAAVKKNISLMHDVPAERPDIESAQEQRQTAQAELQTASSQFAVATEEAVRFEKQLKKLHKLEDTHAEQLARFAKLSAFADAIAGSKGISLKRYILGVMLSTVTAQANRLLSNVHGGRYKLYRRADTNAKAKKLGLDLEVFDSYSGKRRDVSTLSGGEKFLVSLALSIGLSIAAQMQSGGIRTDAMFIDEGFGTLDSGSVADALDILAHLGSDSSVIGIISHIPALRENITSCIEVKKERSGSTAIVHV